MRLLLLTVIFTLIPSYCFAQSQSENQDCYDELVALAESYRQEEVSVAPDKEYMEWLSDEMRSRLSCATSSQTTRSIHNRSVIAQVVVMATVLHALVKTASSAIRIIAKAATSPFTKEVRLAEKQAAKVTAQLKAKRRKARQLEKRIAKNNGEANAKMLKQIAKLQESVNKLQQKVSVLEAKEETATTINLNAKCRSNFGPSIITHSGSSVNIKIKMDGGSANLILVLKDKNLVGSFSNTFGDRGSISLVVSKKSIAGSFTDSEDSSQTGALVFRRCSRR